MPSNREHLPYAGESAQDRSAFQRYLSDAERGKTALQLTAVARQLTPDLRHHWSPRSFGPVVTPVGEFDSLVCNVSYHFHRHGQKYGSIRLYTEAALRYFELESGRTTPDEHGLIKFKSGILDAQGRIVSFFG
jgi:hypothetical protein